MAQGWLAIYPKPLPLGVQPMLREFLFLSLPGGRKSTFSSPSHSCLFSPLLGRGEVLAGDNLNLIMKKRAKIRHFCYSQKCTLRTHKIHRDCKEAALWSLKGESQAWCYTCNLSTWEGFKFKVSLNYAMSGSGTAWVTGPQIKYLYEWVNEWMEKCP